MKPVIFIVGALLLTSCGTLGVKAPQQYRLQLTEAQPEPGHQVLPYDLLIDTPMSLQALNTPRIAFDEADGQQTYFANVAWTDRAPVVVEDALVQAFRASGSFKGLAGHGAGIKPDYILQSQLRQFEAAGTNGYADQVRIELAANLIRVADRRIVASRTFSVILPVTDGTFASTRAAFAQAASNITGDVAVWAYNNLRNM